MPISARQFLEELKARRLDLPEAQRCVSCSIPLQETITGCRKTEDGHKCSDCYYEEIGEELEKSPLFTRRISHGAHI